MPIIALKLLDADPRNANVCDQQTLDKIAKNIQRTGFCPPLIVRSHPEKKGRYVILDGHHRKQVLETLQWKDVECQIWTLSEEDIQLALVTLNQLRGSDNLRKRAELLESLTQTIPIPDLADLIPESPPEIESLLASLTLDLQAMEAQLKERETLEKASLPVPFSCMISAAEYPIVEQVLSTMNAANRGEALVKLCKEAMKHHGP